MKYFLLVLLLLPSTYGATISSSENVMVGDVEFGLLSTNGDSAQLAMDGRYYPSVHEHQAIMLTRINPATDDPYSTDPHGSSHPISNFPADAFVAVYIDSVGDDEITYTAFDSCANYYCGSTPRFEILGVEQEWDELSTETINPFTVTWKSEADFALVPQIFADDTICGGTSQKTNQLYARKGIETLSKDIYINCKNSGEYVVDVIIDDNNIFDRTTYPVTVLFPETEPEEQFTLRVTVRDLRTNDPIWGATLELLEENEVIETSVSDKEGQAYFTQHNGLNTIRVSANGYLSKTEDHYGDQSRYFYSGTTLINEDDVGMIDIQVVDFEAFGNSGASTYDGFGIENAQVTLGELTGVSERDGWIRFDVSKYSGRNVVFHVEAQGYQNLEEQYFISEIMPEDYLVYSGRMYSATEENIHDTDNQEIQEVTEVIEDKKILETETVQAIPEIPEKTVENVSDEKTIQSVRKDPEKTMVEKVWTWLNNLFSFLG